MNPLRLNSIYIQGNRTINKDEKTNEITVIPELLELMDLKGILLILLKMCKRQVKRLKSTLGIEK